MYTVMSKFREIGEDDGRAYDAGKVPSAMPALCKYWQGKKDLGARTGASRLHAIALKVSKSFSSSVISVGLVRW